MTLADLTNRQRCELLSLAGFPMMALDDQAAEELAKLGLVRRAPERGYTTMWYRFTDAGRALLPPVQVERLEATERMYEARTAALAKVLGGLL